MLNSRSEFNRCYITRLRVEDQENIRELEAMEEEELNSIKVSLMEEDTVREQGNVRRAEGIRSTLVPGSSVKREGVEQGAGGRRKREP